MARTAAPTAPKTDDVAHEHFCLPREGADAPRIERYTLVGDDGTGHERPLIVTRCMECGAARYTNPS